MFRVAIVLCVISVWLPILAGTAQAEHDETGEEGEHGTPAEPPERARDQLGERVRTRVSVRLFEVLGLNEVEVIKQSDPGDTEKEVAPASQIVDQHLIHGCLPTYSFW